MNYIEGGVCAPKGFTAAGMHVGIRANKEKNDLMVIFSMHPCSSAGIFTKNIVCSGPVKLNRKNIIAGNACAFIANSGIANACCPNCNENALRMQHAAAQALKIENEQVLVASTGIIGVRLPVEKIENNISELVSRLENSAEGSNEAALAIMTTDTRKKEFAISGEISGKTVTIGGIAKGSGMIHPNMGTMLCFLTTDCLISASMLDKALRNVCDVTFNRISVDGDTSTNDSMMILANGLACNNFITEENDDFILFESMLRDLCTRIARAMAADGEGAKHLITCTVLNSSSEQKASHIAKSIISSNLTKTAIFGCDANWGRVLCAMGYSGEKFNPDAVDIYFRSDIGTIKVCENGIGVNFDETLAKEILLRPEIEILANINEGNYSATCWGCDMTYDYISINGDYRT